MPTEELDPDLLFFAGDQSYHHTEHTYGWLEFGIQFRDVLKDRPVITIPDDHDVGQANIWGENGKQATNAAGPSGGYFYPAKYVNMVQRCQTWHLPDPVDDQVIERGIGVYCTRLRVGGIDFAIVEDRKFKSGPQGKFPKMGPRPDHINNKNYDPKSVDVEGLKLLGDRQLKFLNDWGQDWTGAEMKCVLSQTAFCGAVHLHGSPDTVCWRTSIATVGLKQAATRRSRRFGVHGRFICAVTSIYRSLSNMESRPTAMGPTRLPVLPS